MLRTVLLLIGLGFNTCTFAQSQPITFSVSPHGSSVLTYYIPLVPGCFRTRATFVTRTLNQFSILSEVVPQACFPTPPGGTPPVTAVADLGHLQAGQYQAIWSTVFPLSGGSLPPATTSFTIAQDQLAPAIPASTSSTLVAMALACAGIGMWACNRTRLQVDIGRAPKPHARVDPQASGS